MAGTNKINVMINGVRYPIRSVESPQYVHQLAEELDETLRELILRGRLSINEALVLVGMEYLDAYKKAERNLDNMRDQLTEYMEDAQKAREELAKAQRELERLTGKEPAHV